MNKQFDLWELSDERKYLIRHESILKFINKFTRWKIKELSEKYWIWFETMKDVLAELERPGLDPRDEIQAPVFKSDVLEIKDLQEWMELEWIVRNVTDFWAFVDIGLHNDWLVHKSQMADFFVKNPIDVVSVWQQVKVKVVSIDLEREKVWLSMKDCDNSEVVKKVESHSKFKNPQSDKSDSSFLKGAQIINYLSLFNY